jgi:hypothetical protein
VNKQKSQEDHKGELPLRSGKFLPIDVTPFLLTKELLALHKAFTPRDKLNRALQ